MSAQEPPREPPLGASPAAITDNRLQFEAARAAVWAGVVGLLVLTVYLSQTLLILFGALVFAALVDGGARLLERVLPIARGLRIALVLLATAAFLVWLVMHAGAQIADQASQLPDIITTQLVEAIAYLRQQGINVEAEQVRAVVSNLVTGIGTLRSMIGGLFGGIATLLLIVVIGIYLAVDPRIYERGVGWMVPVRYRDAFFHTVSCQARTLRRLLAGRLLGMTIEAVFTWAMLAIYGVPMALVLGLLTGLLAFIPNIGALISGVLMVLVGFSGGLEMGIYTVVVYLLVQNFDGYVLVPMIAKKTVDLAPALVLSAQLVFGVLFGILGLALADPLLAMMKVGLEQRASRINGRQGGQAEAD